jgi:hypothetical protein
VEPPKVKNVQRVVPAPPNLKRVVLKDYNSGDEKESPPMSLADLQGRVGSSSRPSSIASDTDLDKYQSVEKHEWLHFAGNKSYKMHLKNKGKKYGFLDLAKDENNMLVGSWAFHQVFDCLNHGQKVPVIAIVGGDIMEDLEVEFGTKRRKVMLTIEFHNEEVESAVSSMLKEGSKNLGGLSWESFVHVTNPKLFKECLQWKYDHTKKLWTEEQELLDAE